MSGDGGRVCVTVEGIERLLADLQAPPGQENESNVPAAVGHLTDDELMEYGLGTATPEAILRVEEHALNCNDCALEVGLMAGAAADWAGEEGCRRLEALTRSVLLPPVAELLVHDLRTGRGNEKVAAATLVGLHGGAMATPAILEGLAAMLCDHDSRFVEAAADALSRLGAAATPLLRNRLRELVNATTRSIFDGSIRKAVLDALHRTGPFEGVITLLADVAPPKLAARTDRVERGRTDDSRFRWTVAATDGGSLVITLAVDGEEHEGTRLALRGGPWRASVVLERVAPDQVGAQVVLTREERAAIPIGTSIVSEVLRDR